MDRKARRTMMADNLKLIRRKYEELGKLYKVSRSLGEVELEKPIHKGFKKYWVLQDHALRSNIKPRLQRLLSKFNTVIYCDTKVFKHKSYCGVRGHKKGDPIVMIPKEYITPLNDPYKGIDDDLRKYCYITTEKYKNVVRLNPEVIRRYFKERIRPHYITHVRLIDPELESITDKLSDWLHDSKRFNKLKLYRSNNKFYKKESVKKMRAHNRIDLKYINEDRFCTSPNSFNKGWWD